MNALPTTSRPLKVAISAGELSGDQHGARLLEALKCKSSIECKGMGGAALQSAGMQLTLDFRVHGGLNGFNIPLILYKSLGALTRFFWLLRSWKPDVVVLIDYPDFNLRLAKISRLLGIPTVYYIPPKAWAWRKRRVVTMRRWVDCLVGIFPFEKDFYLSAGHPNFRYVGHPFAAAFRQDRQLDPEYFHAQRIALCHKLNLNSERPIIAVLPGSRTSEILRHLSPMILGLRLLLAKIPDVQIVLPVAPSINTDLLLSSLPKDLADVMQHLTFTTEPSLDVMRAADVGLLKSGTCNLEAAFLGLPFVCCYKVSPVAAVLLRRILKIKEFSLVNIIKSGTTKELMQDDASPENFATELEKLLTNSEYVIEQRKNLQAVVTMLQSHDQDPLYSGATTASERAAAVVTSMASQKNEVVKTKSLNRLWAFARPYKLQFVGAFVAMILYGATDGILPLLIKHILDGVFAERNKSMLQLLPVMLICFAIFRAVVDFCQSYLTARIGHWIVRDLRNSLSRQLVSLSPSFFVRKSVADILSRFTSDVMPVKDLLTSSLTSVVRDGIRIVALLASAIYLDPFMALMTFVIFPLAIIPVYQFGRRIRKLSKRGQDAIGSLSTIVQEACLGSKVVKIFGREQFEVNRFSDENDRLTKTFIKSEFIRAIGGPVNELLATFAIAGVILYGGFSVMNGSRSQGEFIAFLAAIFLLYDPFKKISNLNNHVQQGLSGAERLFELLDTTTEEPEVTKVVAPLPSDYSVCFENVEFTHEQSDSPALKNIHLTIPHGSSCALVGFSGSGKSTLVDLLPRFLTPAAGCIKIGGVDIKNLPLHQLRELIAMVGQHTFLFNDTIFNNIAYGKANSTEDEVFNAARAAYAYDFIKAFPKGFNTMVGEAGMSLSGGERQRIAIARAILKDAPILILDEATASLDNKAEREVQLALDRLLTNRTSLVIAHRLSTIREVDCIVVMEEGRIVETGTHDELLKQNGAFRHLYELQFSKEDNSMQRSEELH